MININSKIGRLLFEAQQLNNEGIRSKTEYLQAIKGKDSDWLEKQLGTKYQFVKDLTHKIVEVQCKIKPHGDFIIVPEIKESSLCVADKIDMMFWEILNAKYLQDNVEFETCSFILQACYINSQELFEELLTQFVQYNVPTQFYYDVKELCELTEEFNRDIITGDYLRQVGFQNNFNTHIYFRNINDNKSYIVQDKDCQWDLAIPYKVEDEYGDLTGDTAEVSTPLTIHTKTELESTWRMLTGKNIDEEVE